MLKPKAVSKLVVGDLILDSMGYLAKVIDIPSYGVVTTENEAGLVDCLDLTTKEFVASWCEVNADSNNHFVVQKDKVSHQGEYFSYPITIRKTYEVTVDNDVATVRRLSVEIDP